MNDETPDKLNRLRLKKAMQGHTQAQIKKMSGLNYVTVWRFITGRSNPPLHIYSKLLSLLTKLEGKKDEKH